MDRLAGPLCVRLQYQFATIGPTAPGPRRRFVATYAGLARGRPLPSPRGRMSIGGIGNPRPDSGSDRPLLGIPAWCEGELPVGPLIKDSFVDGIAVIRDLLMRTDGINDDCLTP